MTELEEAFDEIWWNLAAAFVVLSAGHAFGVVLVGLFVGPWWVSAVFGAVAIVFAEFAAYLVVEEGP